MNNNSAYYNQHENMDLPMTPFSRYGMENATQGKNFTYPSDIKIIFEFPPKSDEDEKIQMEVREIMASAMREHLSRPS